MSLLQWNTVLVLVLVLLCVMQESIHCRKIPQQKRKRNRYSHSTYASSFFGLNGADPDSLLENTDRNIQRDAGTSDRDDSANLLTVMKAEYLKPDWCKTQPLKQVIREKGCLKRKIMNNLCYGQCNSFFVPEVSDTDPAFVSCTFCKPKRFSWMTITLRCPGKRPRFKRKRIQRIQKCRCMPQKLD